MDEGAWCLSSSGCDFLLHEVPKGSRCHQDKHKAPTLPHIRPMSLQDPIRSSTFSRGADLSAFAGCAAIPMNLLNRIIGPRWM